MLKIIAHRGYSGNYPENTLLAFQKAIEAGAKYIELDIHLTKDGEIAVIHDFTLERTAGILGIVSEMTLAEIKKIPAGYPGKFSNSFLDEHVPSLQETLVLCKNKVQLLIEIKRQDSAMFYDDDLEDRAISILEDYEMSEDVMFVSFNLQSLAKVKSIMPGMVVGCLFYELDEYLIDRAIDIDASYVIFNYKKYASPSIIDKAKLKGLQVGLYTIDDVKDFEKFRYSVEAIATNYIKEMLDYFSLPLANS